MYSNCVEVVESRKKAVPNLDTTKILNELLANDKWLEQVTFGNSIFHILFKECFNIVKLQLETYHNIIFIFLQSFKRMQDLWADADTFVR